MTRSEATLVMLALAGGKPYEPVQIQKAMYLVTKKLPHLIEDRSFSFRPYDYGPFDDDVYREAEAAEKEGLARISKSGRWKTYAASDDGVRRAAPLLDGLDAKDRERLTRISDLVRNLSFSQLVKAIYDAYPEMKANSVFNG